MSKLDELLDLAKKLEAKTDDLEEKTDSAEEQADDLEEQADDLKDAAEDLAEKSDDGGDADSSAKEKTSGWAIAGRIAVCCMIAADIYYLGKKFD